MKSLKQYIAEADDDYDMRRNPIDSHYSQPADESNAIAQLSKLPQPITINGGSYGYRVDVTKQPLQFVASDGAVVTKAKTLRDIADWMDDPHPWIDFLDGNEDLRFLLDYNIVRPAKARTTPWSDQEEHELRQMRGESLEYMRKLAGLTEGEEEPHDSASPINGSEADGKPNPAMTEDGNRELNIGDPVIIKGKVNFSGTTGEVVDFGKDKYFVVVNLYNHGKHSFQSSDVAYNDYAGSEEEELDNMRRLAGYR